MRLMQQLLLPWMNLSFPKNMDVVISKVEEQDMPPKALLTKSKYKGGIGKSQAATLIQK
jgi:hypothetical protein